MVTALDNMKKGLRSFRRYVPGDLVYQLKRSNTEATLSAERRTLSVCFCDIADFTTISEAYDPGRLARHLGAYFEGMTRILQEHEATVDKFIGDAIMAFWGAPRDVPDHARLACHAILRCREFIAEFIRQEGRPPCRPRVGLNYGEAIVGNMGYEDRLSYTAIGDTVNVASRYEGINKVYGTSAVVTEAVRNLTHEEFAFREIDTVVVKGRTRGMKVYELLGAAGGLHGRTEEEPGALGKRPWTPTIGGIGSAASNSWISTGRGRARPSWERTRRIKPWPYSGNGRRTSSSRPAGQLDGRRLPEGQVRAGALTFFTLHFPKSIIKYRY
jgi:class 3 adenylate cyclase